MKRDGVVEKTKRGKYALDFRVAHRAEGCAVVLVSPHTKGIATSREAAMAAVRQGLALGDIR